jgi:hypothetical protein
MPAIEGNYEIFGGTAGGYLGGPIPSREWREVGAALRRQNLVREAGVMAGHVVASLGFVTQEYRALQYAGKSFADDFEPPLNSTERSNFMQGIEEVITVNRALEELYE